MSLALGSGTAALLRLFYEGSCGVIVDIFWFQLGLFYVLLAFILSSSNVCCVSGFQSLGIRECGHVQPRRRVVTQTNAPRLEKLLRKNPQSSHSSVDGD